MSQLETKDKLTMTHTKAIDAVNMLISIMFANDGMDGSDPNEFDPDKEWDSDTTSCIAQSMETYIPGFDVENPKWVARPSECDKICHIRGLPEDVYTFGGRLGRYPNVTDEQVELLVGHEMDLFSLHPNDRWNPGEQNLERYLRSQHGEQVEVSIYETDPIKEALGDGREKLLHICDLMDKVEESMIMLNEGKIIVDGEALLTLQDFIVNYCGEDEA